MNCGRGSNTSGELLALWSQLFFYHAKNIVHLQVVGDSKVIIDWDNQKCQLQVAILEGWKDKITRLQSNFEYFAYQHVYKEYHVESNGLSKQSLYLLEGILYNYEIYGSNTTLEGSISIFWVRLVA